MEKKLTAEEISQLTDQITKKELEVNKAAKELDKHRFKMERNDEETS